MSMRPAICFALPALFVVTVVRFSPVSAEERTWTDHTGKHTIDAEFVRFKDGEVTLRKSNGKQITLSLEKLSKEDREYARRKAVTKGPGNTKISDRASIRDVSKKFFKALRDESDDEMGAALSEQARQLFEAKSSPVEKLPSPDPGPSIRVGRVSTDGDTATADVSIRFQGRFQKTTLNLRRESDAWRVHKISAKGPDGDLVTFDFEEGDPDGMTGGAAGAGGAGGAGSGVADDEQFALPTGGPVELLRFIRKLKDAPLPKVQNPAQALAFQKERFAAILKAADKILEDENASNQHEKAVEHKFLALKALSQLGVSEVAEKLAQLPGELEAMGLADLAGSARSVVLQVQVGQLGRGSATKAEALFKRIEKHLQNVSLGAEEAGLARTAGDAAPGLVGNKAAGAIHHRLGTLLTESQDKAIAAIGERMLGAARRLTLVGNPMRVEGVLLNGSPLDWSSYEGKVVLVDYWATWCRPCIQELPNVKEAYAKYHDKGFEVVGISLDTNRQKVQAFLESKEIPWVTMFSDDKEATEWEHPMVTYYGITGIPTAILIGPDGNVISLNCRGKSLGEHLENLLGEAG